jgi:hypothetical protein
MSDTQTVCVTYRDGTTDEFEINCYHQENQVWEFSLGKEHYGINTLTLIPFRNVRKIQIIKDNQRS